MEWGAKRQMRGIEFLGFEITQVKLLVVRFEVFTAVVTKSIIFWDITPCSPLSVNRRFGGTNRLHLQGVKISVKVELCLPPAFTLVSCSAYFSTPKMGAPCSSEMSVDFQRTTRRYITEDRTLHNHRCESFK
jgi:hypothetical protein